MRTRKSGQKKHKNGEREKEEVRVNESCIIRKTKSHSKYFKQREFNIGN